MSTDVYLCAQTLPSAVAHKRRKSEERNSSSPNTELQPQSDPDHDSPLPTLRDLMTRRVLVPIINYGFLAFMEQCCSVLMPLVYATSIPYGGLGLDSFTIGIIMSALGITVGISSVVLFPMLLRRFGIYRLYRAAISCYPVTVGTYPLMNLLAKRAGRVDGYVWVVLVIQLCGTVASCMAFSKLPYLNFSTTAQVDRSLKGCAFIYFSDSAPTKSALGAINGLAQTVACTVRIFGPLIASSLFSFTHQHNLLGGTMVYWILWLVTLATMYASSHLPKHLKSEDC